MSFAKVNTVFEKSTIVNYNQVSKTTGNVECDNLKRTLAVPITSGQVIEPGLGDEIKYLVITNNDEVGLSEIVPIEIKIKGMKSRLTIDYEYLIAGLGLQLNDKKPLFSAISKKARFINAIELLKDKHLLPFSF